MVITINGKPETIFCLEELLDHISTHMGWEVREALMEFFVGADELDSLEAEHQQELDEIREYYQKVIEDIRDESELLAELIRQPRLDRRRISSAAGRIGLITWRAL